MKSFIDLLREDKSTELKVGDTANFHNDLKKMVSGEIIKISNGSNGKKIFILDRYGIKFRRTADEVYP